MGFTFPFFRQSAPPLEVPAIVRGAAVGDGHWNRPVFRAPPLEVQPPLNDIQQLTAEIQNRIPLVR